MRRLALAVALAASLFGLDGPPRAGEAKPKYGPAATLLARSHEYVRESEAPDLWALLPYYVGQDDDHSCSVASVAMVVNAARAGHDLGADDELATQRSLQERVKADAWRRGMGVTLDELGPIARDAMKAYGFERATAEVVHTPDRAPATAEALHRALLENERTAKDFIIANFNQAAYTGDASVGHVAPIAAYDAKRRRVLVLDPDRKWYEPYWVSEETFLAGMATVDEVSGKARGYVWVKSTP